MEAAQGGYALMQATRGGGGRENEVARKKIMALLGSMNQRPAGKQKTLPASWLTGFRKRSKLKLPARSREAPTAFAVGRRNRGATRAERFASRGIETALHHSGRRWCKMEEARVH
jgi:hypothetical protein